MTSVVQKKLSWSCRMRKTVLERVGRHQKNITSNNDLSRFGYIKHGFTSGGTQKWMLKLAAKQYKQNNKTNISKYYQDNKEKFLIQHKNYYENHKEEIAKYKKRYSQTERGKEVHRKANKQYYQTENAKDLRKKYYRSEECRKARKLYYNTKGGRKAIKNAVKKYRRSEKGKEMMLRSIHKRKRNLRFIPLNNHFEGSDAHHINREEIIYIPKKLHKSIYHNLNTGKNMKEINELTFQRLKAQTLISEKHNRSL